METIQLVLDKQLLVATNRAARQTKLNRSAFIREALAAHLRNIELRAKEKRDREGYEKYPQTYEESHLWTAEGVWPSK